MFVRIRNVFPLMTTARNTEMGGYHGFSGNVVSAAARSRLTLQQIGLVHYVWVCRRQEEKPLRNGLRWYQARLFQKSLV